LILKTKQLIPATLKR